MVNWCKLVFGRQEGAHPINFTGCCFFNGIKSRMVLLLVAFFKAQEQHAGGKKLPAWMRSWL